MSLLFATGFDALDNTSLAKIMTVTTPANANIDAAGRRNAKGLKLKSLAATSTSSWGGYYNPPSGIASIGFPSTVTVIVGFALKQLVSTAAGWPIWGGYPIMRLSDGVDSIGHILIVMIDGGIVVLRPSGSANASITTLVSCNANVPVGTWAYWELKITLNSATAGSITVRCNGTQVGTAAGIRTTDSWNTIGGAFVNTLMIDALRSTGAGAVDLYLLDDLYIADTSGTVNNDYLGDVSIVGYAPSGAGANSGFAPVGAASNYQAVQADDADSSYVVAAVAPAVDTYTFPQFPTAGVVRAVQVVPIVRTEEAGSRTITAKVRQGGANYSGSSRNPSNTTYAAAPLVMERNPATNQLWTPAEVNASEFGIELTA